MKKLAVKILQTWYMIREYLKVQWWMFTNRRAIKVAIKKADQKKMRKGTQQHVIKVGNELMVVDNQWHKRYNLLMRRNGGKQLGYNELLEKSLYSTR